MELVEHERREQVDRPDRQVDLSGHHEHDLADCKDRERSEVRQQVLDVGGRQEMLVDAPRSRRLARIVTTTMLPSRRVSNRRAVDSPPPAPGLLAGGGEGDEASASVGAPTPVELISLGAHPDRLRRTLVARLGAVIGLHGALVEELQPGVDVSHPGQRLGHGVQVQLQDGQEALQVRLLVDGEVELVLRRAGFCVIGVMS